MTYAAVMELGLKGKHDANITWTIRENAGEDASSKMTLTEINAGFTTGTWNTDYYTYRGRTTKTKGGVTGDVIDYPQDWFTPTPCN